MTIYFDENLSPVFAEGLQKLQEPYLNRRAVYSPVHLKYIPAVFGRGCSDPEFFAKLAGTESCCITLDRGMRTKPHERVLYEQAGLGLFILDFGKKCPNYWEQVEILVKRWPAILQISLNQPRPFSCLIPRVGNRHYRLL